jgi:hypothetical protein
LTQRRYQGGSDEGTVRFASARGQPGASSHSELVAYGRPDGALGELGDAVGELTGCRGIEAVGRRAEVIVDVFDASNPMRRESVIDAAADAPADQVLRQNARRQDARRVRQRYFIVGERCADRLGRISNRTVR